MKIPINTSAPPITWRNIGIVFAVGLGVSASGVCVASFIFMILYILHLQ